jgi:hypothetical protein
MLKPADPAAVRRFVRHTLGCACPDEVFNVIDSSNGSQASGSCYDSRLRVGKRLLIYLLTVEGPERLAVKLPQALSAGKRERDARGFNRFRAVLVAADRASITGPAQRLFEAWVEKDDRTHLHVVAPAEVADIGPA